MSENILDLIRQLKEGEISRDKMVEMLVQKDTHIPPPTSNITTSSMPVIPDDRTRGRRGSGFKSDLSSQFPLLSLNDIQQRLQAPAEIMYDSYSPQFVPASQETSVAHLHDYNNNHYRDSINVHFNYHPDSEIRFASPDPTVQQFAFHQGTDRSNKINLGSDQPSLHHSIQSELENIDFASKSYDFRQENQNSDSRRESELKQERGIQRSSSYTSLRKPPLSKQIETYSAKNSARKATPERYEGGDTQQYANYTMPGQYSMGTRERTQEETFTTDTYDNQLKHMNTPNIFASTMSPNNFNTSNPKLLGSPSGDIWSTLKNMQANQNSRMSSSIVSQSLLERSKNFQLRKHLKIMKELERKMEKETEGCSFHPQINSRSQQQKFSRTPVGKRLYEARGVKVSNAKHQILKQQEEEFKEKYTFKPKLTPVPGFLREQMIRQANQEEHFPSNSVSVVREQPESAEYSEKGTERSIMNLNNLFNANNPNNSALLSIPKPLNKFTVTEAERECTFKPHTNTVSAEMDKVKAYLQRPVIDRLYNQDYQDCFFEAKRNRKLLEEAEKFNRELQRGSLVDVGTYSTLSDGQERNIEENLRRAFLDTNMSNVADIENPHKMSFYERQAYFVLKKMEDLQKIQAEMSQSHQPAISYKSREIVETKGKGNFIERNMEFLRAKEEHLRELARERIEAEQFDYRPEITPLGQMTSPKDLDQLCYGDIKKKRHTIEQLRMENEKNFVKNHTFRPQLETVNENVKSKLGLELSPPAYVNHVMRANIEKEQRRILAEQNKEEKELEECTFKPEITKLPSYIKKINEASRIAYRTSEKENVTQ